MNRRVVTWDLDGWKDIASALGRSEDFAQRAARAGEDPLPVKRFGGRVTASSEEVRAWAKRHEAAA